MEEMEEINKLEIQREEGLKEIEGNLRQVIKEKNQAKLAFESKIKELKEGIERQREWFDNEWKKLTKTENKLILTWDYFNREVEILGLERKMLAGVDAVKREELLRKIGTLHSYNLGIRKIFREKKSEPELIEKLRKKIGVWEI